MRLVFLTLTSVTALYFLFTNDALLLWKTDFWEKQLKNLEVYFLHYVQKLFK